MSPPPSPPSSPPPSPPPPPSSLPSSLPSLASSLVVRLATTGDAAACAAIYRPYVEETSVSFEVQVPSADEMASRIARTLLRAPWLVVEEDGVVRGYAYATRHRERPAYDWTAETAVYVERGLHGRGIGRTAMTALLEILRLQGFHLAVAGIALPNPASVGLHLALGYRQIGVFEAIGWKLGQWQDVAWFGLELGPRPEAAAPITPVDHAVAAWSQSRG